MSEFEGIKTRLYLDKTYLTSLAINSKREPNLKRRVYSSITKIFSADVTNGNVFHDIYVIGFCCT